MFFLVSIEDILCIKFDRGKKDKCICFFRNIRLFKCEKKCNGRNWFRSFNILLFKNEVDVWYYVF